ncbi:MAG: NTP transferase domain-containing protein [Candidatus Omnitrophica bacterium]|nr:NTP transferase domain-containing protein [Candidatus Omnitrophota bacterium]
MKRSAKNVGIIMCGGVGERFWPVTRENLPKYALEFNGKTTFLEETYRRILPVFGNRQIYVVTAQTHVKLIRKILPAIPPDRILAEPCRRNTAAATALTAAVLKHRLGDDAVLAFFPADAMILKTEKFRQILKRALSKAAKDPFGVVIGIKPTRPSSAYGYVECGKRDRDASGALEVLKFHEKPSAELAQKYLKSGRFVWNAGIFVWRVGVFEHAIKAIAPEYWSHFEKMPHSVLTRPLKLRSMFRSLPSTPVDRLLVERMKGLKVFPADIGWDDIGNWEALRRMSHDASGNTILGDVRMRHTSRSVIRVPRGVRASVLGISGVVVVLHRNRLLVCAASGADGVKDLQR